MPKSNVVVKEINLTLNPNQLDIIANAMWESVEQHEEHINCFGKFKSIKRGDNYIRDIVDKKETDALDRENYITILRLCKQIHKINNRVRGVI
tara:strand:- start:463 stop:741 length:279 start_codon:yes stop_codon:yes gene_type:complete